LFKVAFNFVIPGLEGFLSNATPGIFPSSGVGCPISRGFSRDVGINGPYPTKCF
jgi:hypothetical protein